MRHPDRTGGGSRSQLRTALQTPAHLAVDASRTSQPWVDEVEAELRTPIGLAPTAVPTPSGPAIRPLPEQDKDIILRMIFGNAAPQVRRGAAFVQENRTANALVAAGFVGLSALVLTKIS